MTKNWLFLSIAEESPETAGYILLGLLVAGIFLFGILFYLTQNRNK